MRHFFRRACVGLLLSVVGLTGLGFGCSTGAQPGNDGEVLLAEVDSIHAPAQVSPTDTLSIRLVGTIGPNGCYSLEELKAERSEGQLTLVPSVRHVTNRMCTMAIVPLDVTHQATPPFEEGTFQVVVPQSDRPDLTADIEVTSGEDPD